MPSRLFGRLVLVLALAVTAVGPATARAEIAFTAAPYSTLSGERTGPNVFTAAGIEKECDEAGFNGALNGSSRTLELEPLYGDCTAKVLSGLAVKFVLGRCTYLVRPTARRGREESWKADVGLSCPTEFKLQWNLYEDAHGYETGAVVCTTSMLPRAKIGTAVLSNRSGAHDYIAIRWNLRAIEYRAYGSELLCGSSFGVLKDDAWFAGTSRIAAKDLQERPVDLALSD